MRHIVQQAQEAWEPVACVAQILIVQRAIIVKVMYAKVVEGLVSQFVDYKIYFMNQKYLDYKKKYENKKVVIMGLGLHGGGIGSARFFSELGSNVVVTDLKTEEELNSSIEKLKDCKNIEYVLGGHREEDFKNSDLIIKNPGVRDTSTFLKLAIENNIEIDTDIGIFFSICENEIIGITGTKGKSTTTKLITELLETKYNVVAGGNYRVSVLDIQKELKKDDVIILELSSWQLEGLEKHKLSPHISVLTNLFEDHLNTYDNSMQNYANAKNIIFRFQKENDFSIINSDNENTFKYFNFDNLKSNKIYFSKKNIENNLLKNFKLFGNHNLENLAAAISVAKIMNIEDKNIEKVLENFKAPEGRQELVREINGIKFINDTTATSPSGAIQALNSVKGKIILMAGGVDKNLDYKEFGELIIEKFNKKELKNLVLFKNSFTTATDKILNIIDKKVEYEFADSMEDAISKAYKNAANGDSILLSPGGASFGMFQHEFDRGEQFNNIVKSL